jgi:hypothetical protein
VQAGAHVQCQLPKPSPDQQRESASAFLCLPAVPVTRLETLTSGLPIASNHHIGTPFGPSPKRSDAKQLILLHQSSSRPRFAHSVHRSEGTSARALSAILTLVERKGREGQALGATEALSNGNARMFDIQPEVRGGGWGVAGRSVAHPILDVNPLFRGLFRRNPSLPKSARLSPRKSRSAKTQPWLSIASRVMSATREAVRSQNAPATVSESWRGMLP